MTETLTGYDLADRYRRTEGRVLLTGIQALARIVIEQLRRDQQAGLNTAAFLAGYPGSPLGGLDQEVARARALVPDLPIVHQPAVNEELGATAVMGSQLAPGRPDARYEGVVGVWYGKAPGLDRAGDALRHGVFAGASPKGGALVLVGDDPACSSSTMPSSSDATLVDLHMPILYPGTTEECLELGLHAVAMSRASGLWSSMKIVTPVADGFGTVTLPVLDADPIIPTHDIDGVPWTSHPSAHFLGPRMLEVEREFREIRLPLARRYGAANGLNRISIDPSDAWIGLVATGFTYYELLDALRRLGLDSERAIADAGIRVLQLRMPVPFDPDIVRSFARGLDEIVVVEEKNPTLEWLVKDALYGGPSQPLVLGKTHEDGRTLMKSWGRLDADAMLPGLRERLGHTARRPAGARTARGTRQAGHPGRHRPHPVLLLRVPAQLGDEGARRGARRCWHRLPRHDAADGRGASRGDHRHHGDGQRGGPVDRHGAVRRRRPPVPQLRRRHVLPLGAARPAVLHRRRQAHDVQDPLQRHDRHDRWAGRAVQGRACPSWRRSCSPRA